MSVWYRELFVGPVCLRLARWRGFVLTLVSSDIVSRQPIDDVWHDGCGAVIRALCTSICIGRGPTYATSRAKDLGAADALADLSSSLIAQLELDCRRVSTAVRLGTSPAMAVDARRRRAPTSSPYTGVDRAALHALA